MQYCREVVTIRSESGGEGRGVEVDGCGAAYIDCSARSSRPR